MDKYLLCKLLLTFCRACKITCSYDDLLFQSSVSVIVSMEKTRSSTVKSRTTGTLLFFNYTNKAYFISVKQKVIFDLITCISDCVVSMLTWCTWMFRLLCSVVQCCYLIVSCVCNQMWLKLSIVMQSLLVIKSFNNCCKALQYNHTE